ncbi:hypothetical protein PINS_up012122 [Pythium insidiosum]|nr:hypothetical protein PINS_up012122 [Pythium insidiosum]
MVNGDEDVASPQLWQALHRRHLRRKVVRDLLWAVTSPHLIDARHFPVLPPDIGIPSDPIGEELLIRWLQGLQQDPAHIVAFLQDKSRSRSKALALGVYFASLLEYWLRYCPTLHPARFEVGKQIISATNQTLGQLKFLFRLCAERADDDNSDWTDYHVESSVKFFLLHPENSSSDATPHRLEHFVGPHLGENLAWRTQEVARKLDMCRGDSVQRWLREHYSDNVQSRVVLRGYLFYPLQYFASTSCVTRRHDWQLHRNRKRDTAAPASLRPVPPQIGEGHLRGWWTSDLETELPPRVHANETGESRFVVLPKLHWLCPVLAVERRSDADGGVDVVIEGDDDLQVETVSSMTLEELIAFVREHFQSKKAKDDAQSFGGVVMPLLIAEIVRSEVVSSTGKFTSSVVYWEELSRGFVLDPTSWDPRPLCQDAVRYKRTVPSSGPDQERVVALADREYEGHREWSNEGVIRPSDDEVEMARRQKLHQFESPQALTPALMCGELLTILQQSQKTYTHANLKASVQEGRLQSELHYRP